jgi:repressor LexA
LEERGFLRRLAHKARALEVVKLPENASANDIFNTFTPSVIKGGLDTNPSTASEISVLGSIAAGTPIEAIQQEVDRVALPESLENNGEHYGLKVKGDSMIEAGINDGDTVIVKKTNNIDSGQIAVVLIDDQEATLKRVRKKGNTIALEAANKNYGTKIYAAARIKIQGKLVSLYRNFH